MLSKFLVFSVVSLYFVSVAPSLAATDEQINQRINYLQIQINQLRAQKKQDQKRTVHTTRHYRERTSPDGKCIYHASRLGIGPYTNTQEAFGGSELVINIPTVREDTRILLRQHQLEQEYHDLGIPTPPLPRVTLSGKLEGQVTYGNTYPGSKDANVSFSGAELDTYIQGNSWISGYMALDHDPDWSPDGAYVFMNRAFITIGNLSRFPFYSSIGQIYIPFGRYSSLMISPPVTLGLGRTRACALSVGYQQTGDNTLHAEVYDYKGLVNNLSRSDQKNQWGVDFGYAFNNFGRVNGEVGASFISNLINSKMDEILHHTVQAVNFYGSLTIDPVVFIAEYVGALKSFDVTDVSFANQGARRPTAFHTEASYMFHTNSKPSSIGIGYGHTSQALALSLPQDRYSIFYNVNIWMDTNFALEYRHDVNYSRNSISTGIHLTPSGIASDLGKSNNVVTAQFDLYF